MKAPLLALVVADRPLNDAVFAERFERRACPPPADLCFRRDQTSRAPPRGDGELRRRPSRPGAHDAHRRQVRRLRPAQAGSGSPGSSLGPARVDLQRRRIDRRSRCRVPHRRAGGRDDAERRRWTRFFSRRTSAMTAVHLVGSYGIASRAFSSPAAIVCVKCSTAASSFLTRTCSAASATAASLRLVAASACLRRAISSSTPLRRSDRSIVPHLHVALSIGVQPCVPCASPEVFRGLRTAPERGERPRTRTPGRSQKSARITDGDGKSEMRFRHPHRVTRRGRTQPSRATRRAASSRA